MTKEEAITLISQLVTAEQGLADTIARLNRAIQAERDAITDLFNALVGQPPTSEEVDRMVG